MDLVVLADTHLRGGIDKLSPSVRDALESADAIVHAGDVVSPQALDELRRLAPVHAVLGNNDQELVGMLPDRLVLDLDGVRVGLVHDSGARTGRAGRLSRWFPDCQVVVFGHSHVPIDEAGVGGQRLFNPGSPTQRRGQPHRTFGRWRLEQGAVVQLTVERAD